MALSKSVVMLQLSAWQIFQVVATAHKTLQLYLAELKASTYPTFMHMNVCVLFNIVQGISRKGFKALLEKLTTFKQV